MPGPIISYKFDTDYSSTPAGNTIATTGNSAIVSGGQSGSALGKTGATMPVLPGSALTALQTDDRGIMFDAKGNFTTWWVRFEKDAIGSGVWGLLNISGSMAVQARKQSDDSLATRPTATAPDGTNWHNYCATYVRSTGVISIYRDGTLASTQSFPAGTQLSISADRINIAEWSNTGPSMDNLRFWNYAPDSTEVAATAGTPVTGGNTTVIGLATETDTGFSVTRRKSRTAGLATETNTAFAVTRRKSRTIGLATETDTAQSTTRTKLRTIAQAVETAVAFAVTRKKSRTIGLAAETDSAQSVTRSKSKVIGLATEVATALGLTRKKSKAIGLAQELDTARPVTVLSQHVTVIGLAVESDTALPVTIPGSVSDIDFQVGNVRAEWGIEQVTAQSSRIGTVDIEWEVGGVQVD